MKKYLITDPCYLVENRDVWLKFCNLSFREEPDAMAKAGKYLSDFLGVTVQVENTGYGDWYNRMICESGDDGIIQSEFAADAGLVCFCEYTDEIRNLMEKQSYDLYAVITSEETPVCTFDTSNKNWTVVRITAGTSVYRSIISEE